MAFKEGSCGPAKYGMRQNLMCIYSLFQRDCAKSSNKNTNKHNLFDKHNDTDKEIWLECTDIDDVSLNLIIANRTLMMQFRFWLRNIFHWLSREGWAAFENSSTVFFVHFQCLDLNSRYFSILRTRKIRVKQESERKSSCPTTISRLYKHMFAKQREKSH